jgi:hypothetical protein
MVEFLKLRDIKKSISENTHTYGVKDLQDKHLEVIRSLGHQYEMPGSAAWVVEDKQEDCWVCDQSIYTLIFWSPSIGRNFSYKINEELKQKAIETITSYNPFLEPINVDIPKDKYEER